MVFFFSRFRRNKGTVEPVSAPPKRIITAEMCFKIQVFHTSGSILAIETALKDKSQTNKAHQSSI
jgi:hypothetical protein